MKLLLCFLFGSVVSLVNAWHAYSKTKERPSDCGEEKPTNPRIFDQGNPYNLWPGLISQLKSSNPEFLYGLEESLDVIWRNQHPTDCKTAKFFIVQALDQSGFGADVHGDGAALGLAIRLGRVALHAPKVKEERKGWEVHNSFCEAQFKAGNLEAIKNLDCYYEPWSSCTINDALGSDWNSATIENLPRVMLSDEENEYLIFGNGSSSVMERLNNLPQVVQSAEPYYYRHGFIPQQLINVVKCSPVNKKHEYYWWRAIASTYLLRPNKATRGWLDANKDHVRIDPDKDSCVSVYVRRSDKILSEMKAIPMDAYLEAAEVVFDMLDHREQDAGRPGNKTRVIFIGAEESKFLKETNAWAVDKKIQKGRDYRVEFTNFFDRDTQVASVGQSRMPYHFHDEFMNPHQHDQPEEPNPLDKLFHHDLEYLSMLLNIKLSLQCDAWVGTLASNWCRLVDELRTTMAGKLHGIFADLSSETCPSVPCIDQGIDNYDFRT